MLTPVEGSARTRGTIYAWIAAKPGDDLRVGVDTGQGRNLPVLERGAEATYVASDFGDSDDLEVSILNGIDDTEIGRAPESAVVIISGEWRAGRVFALQLEGNASARVWLASDGDLDPSVSVGAVLPRARKAGTICVPGTHPELISVGATLNRTSWVDAAGNEPDESAHGALDDAPEDTTAYFSSAGPTNVGVLKPDIVAPGAFVIGAMSKEADPRSNDFSNFSSGGTCKDPEDECYVVNDDYAVSSGTSMSSPIVAGAVALLLERDPTLTQAKIRDLLQAGARPLEGVTFAPQQVGAGALNLVGALQAQDAAERPVAEPAEATLRLAESFAYPDPAAPLTGLVVLRDAKGEPAAGFDPAKLKFSADGAAEQRWEQAMHGLYRFSVAAPRGSGGSSLKLTVSYDGTRLAEADVPIAVDPAVAEEGFHARGGCSVSASATQSSWVLGGLGMCALVAARRRRWSRQRT
jgi:MYXO-CTERM domain-containing protein